MHIPHSDQRCATLVRCESVSRENCFISHVDGAVLVNIQPINQQVNHLQSVTKSVGNRWP